MNKPKKTERKITLKEFRSWLEGVEAVMTQKAWSPDAAQWKAIRNKIDQIIDQPEPPDIQEPKVVYTIPPSALEGAQQVTRFPAPRNSAGHQSEVIAAMKARRVPEEQGIEVVVLPEGLDVTPAAAAVLKRGSGSPVAVLPDIPYETPFG